MRRRRVRALAAALALLAALSAAARAQTGQESPLIDLGPVIEGLTGGETAAPAPPPGAGPSALPPPPAPAMPAERTAPRAAADESAAPDRGILVRPRLIEADTSLVTREGDGVVRLAGERTRARLGIDLPPPGPDPVLVLSYRNSINVLPRDSAIIVSINGTETARLEANAFDGFRTVEIEAPALVAGSNVVTVETIHRHRIFCGIEASFQIWTEIDLAASGVALPGFTPGDGEASLEAALAGLDGGTPLAVRAAPEADPRVVDALAARLAPAAGGLVEIGSAFDPVVDGAGRPRVVVERGPRASADIVLGGDGAVVLRVVHGPFGNDPSAALPDLSPLLDPGADGGIAGPGAPVLAPGRAAPLVDLGFEPRNDIASFFRETVEFRLPADWLALSSQKAVLFLDYGFAEGLPPGARLLVKANGTTVRLLPLDRGGGMQPTLDVGFLASLLGPGLNRLAFEVIIEAQNPELACPPWPDRILTVSPGSTLLVPDMPRMHFDGMEWALPSLSSAGVVFGRGDGIGSGGMRPRERERFAALMVPVPSEYRSEPPENVTLRVLTIDEFWPAAVGALPLDRASMLDVLAPPFEVVTPDPFETANGGAGEDLLAAALRRMRAALAWIRGLAVPGGPPLDDWLAGRTAEAILLQPEEDAPQSLLLILSPTADPLAVGRAIVADRLMPEGPHGRLALLHEDGAWSSWRPPFDPPRLEEPLTPWNMRAVLGNYASWLPMGFTGLLFLLTLLSAYVALLFVVRTRHPNQR